MTLILEPDTGFWAEKSEYCCPSCGFMILKVFLTGAGDSYFRWTCEHCRRDFCYSTQEPCF